MIHIKYCAIALSVPGRKVILEISEKRKLKINNICINFNR